MKSLQGLSKRINMNKFKNVLREKLKFILNVNIFSLRKYKKEMEFYYMGKLSWTL